MRQQWSGAIPSRPRAGLPPLAWAALGLGGPRAKLRSAAARLDGVLPGWTERVAEAVAEAARLGDGREGLSVACALLGLRPLSRPDVVHRAAKGLPAGAEARLWLMVALAGTDTAAVREMWRDELRGWGVRGANGADVGTWLCFVRCLTGGWLSWEDFRECVVGGRVLDQAAGREGAYRRHLEAVGLWDDARFSRRYRQAVYEAVHQPDVELALGVGAWIRDFPGEEYLWQALSALESRPDNWWPLYVARWTSEVGPDSEETLARLAACSPRTLCVLSLLRPDLCEATERAVGWRDHARVVAWLKETGPEETPELSWVQEVVAPWAALAAEAFLEAVGALCSLAPPGDHQAGEDESRRRQSFLRTHLATGMDRLMDNLFYVFAVGKRHFDLTLAQARKRSPGAVRALALWPERAEETVPVLLQLLRHGGGHSQQAAGEALTTLGENAGLVRRGPGEGGVADTGRLEERVDLSLAWSDADTETGTVAVWWDIAGYRVRLAPAAGDWESLAGQAAPLKVQVWSRERLLASVPARVRGDDRWKEVAEVRRRVGRSYRHFRRRFEQTMVEGTSCTGTHLGLLAAASPVVQGIVSRLVVLVDGEVVVLADPPSPSLLPQGFRLRRGFGGQVGAQGTGRASNGREELPDSGFPGRAGESRKSRDTGQRSAWSAAEVVVAHPVVLHAMGCLERWQDRMIQGRTAQPFKQVFREIYLPSQGEREDTTCQRFAGKPLEAKRAFALLKQQGYAPRRGVAVKEWPRQEVRARIQWAAPEENVGRLLGGGAQGAVTSGAVWFETMSRRPGAASPTVLSLGSVPPVVFSETLRDADLLVSRAAAGEVQFTSEETRRLRGALVRYIAGALGLASVYVSDDCNHVIVDGKLAVYRVHLGSGSVLLEESRRSLDVTGLRDAMVEEVAGGGVDAHTARILGTVVALTRDDEITAAGFREQLGPAPGLPSSGAADRPERREPRGGRE